MDLIAGAVFSMIGDELKYFFKGFKQEDLKFQKYVLVLLALIFIFSGGIELYNLDMNVEVIQDYLAQVAPFIQIEKATVKQLRVTVC